MVYSDKMNAAVVYAFIALSLVELLLVLFKANILLRRIVAAGLVLFLAGTQTALLFLYPSAALVVFWTIGLLRIVNLARTAAARMQESYLVAVTRRSSFRLIVFQALMSGAVYGLDRLDEEGLILALGAALLINVSILLTTLKNARRRALPKADKVSQSELPTVTVAIPARNETEDLAFCIESVLKSDYPKLEILVMDDCSQDRTPEVIKSFAHQGVRFVEGEEPPSSWLAKNAAYQKLADEALGEYIIFCGVDVRFEPTTVSRLLQVMLGRKLDMIGILPLRERALPTSLFLQVARYFWELGLPRRLLNRPAALSTCWIIKKEALERKGGFKAVRRSIMPERYFASMLSNSYLFAGNTLPPLIKSAKSVNEQRATAIRVRYPQLRKRPENVAFYLVVFGLVSVLPPAVLLAALIGEESLLLAGLSTASVLCTMVASSRLYAMTAPRWSLFGLVAAYPVFLVDLATVIISMLKYEFGEVRWKGRNVCLPIMHTTPSLPTSDNN